VFALKRYRLDRMQRRFPILHRGVVEALSVERHHDRVDDNAVHDTGHRLPACQARPFHPCGRHATERSPCRLCSVKFRSSTLDAAQKLHQVLLCTIAKLALRHTLEFRSEIICRHLQQRAAITARNAMNIGIYVRPCIRAGGDRTFEVRRRLDLDEISDRLSAQQSRSDYEECDTETCTPCYPPSAFERYSRHILL